MDNEIVNIKGASYSIGRLSAKKQFAVSRRLGPFIGDVMPSIKELLGGKGDILDRAIDLVPQIVTTLAEMKDEDCDFIIDTCLMVVKRQQDTGWANMTTPDGRVVMFEIDMMEMLELTAEVVKANLMGFFPIGKLEAFAAALATSNLPV